MGLGIYGPYGFLQRAVGEDGQKGAEDLFLHTGILPGDVIQKGGLDL